MSESVSSGSGGGLVRGLGILLLLLLALVVLASLVRGLAIVAPQEVAMSASPTPALQCPTTTASGLPVFIVRLSRTTYPESTAHINDARRLKGKPFVLTLDRKGADQRRYAATKNFPRVAGKEPDEYPPAIALEGGVHADVRNISASDNHRAGASMGRQLTKQPDGSKFCIELTP